MCGMFEQKYMLKGGLFPRLCCTYLANPVVIDRLLHSHLFRNALRCRLELSDRNDRLYLADDIQLFIFPLSLSSLLSL